MGNEPSRLDGIKETFGSQSVTEEARRSAVRSLFDRIAPRYDLMNDLMSFGLHRLWKRLAADAVVDAAASVEGLIVDLAGGTGDIALLVSQQIPERAVMVADASAGMLEIAKKRGGAALAILHAEAENLPLGDQSAAVVSMGFGLRNMADPLRALQEVRRILRPGGTFVLLEFSQPAAWFAPLYRIHSRMVIPALGAMVAGDRGAYRYLVESIRSFPGANDISDELRRAGFESVSLRRLMFGVAALHIAGRGAEEPPAIQ